MERKNSLIGTNKVTTFGTAPERRTTTKNEIYYSVTASSLSKRPLGEIYSSKQKKGRGEKSAAMKPSTKKAFFNRHFSSEAKAMGLLTAKLISDDSKMTIGSWNRMAQNDRLDMVNSVSDSLAEEFEELEKQVLEGIRTMKNMSKEEEGYR